MFLLFQFSKFEKLEARSCSWKFCRFWTKMGSWKIFKKRKPKSGSWKPIWKNGSWKWALLRSASAALLERLLLGSFGVSQHPCQIFVPAFKFKIRLPAFSNKNYKTNKYSINLFLDKLVSISKSNTYTAYISTTQSGNITVWNENEKIFTK